VAEDREQDQPEERHSAARPVTAAARRERRASASGSGPAGRVAERTPAKARPSGAHTRKPAVEPETEETAKGAKGRATPKRDRKQKRPSVLARFFRFLREVVGELRKVIWPTRKQQLTYTAVVLVFVAVIVALVSGLDLLFAKGVFWIFA
jgi:preprotein translocase subunit SecE